MTHGLLPHNKKGHRDGQDRDRSKTSGNRVKSSRKLGTTSNSDIATSSGTTSNSNSNSNSKKSGTGSNKGGRISTSTHTTPIRPSSLYASR